MVIDPICKMEVDEKTAKFKSDIKKKPIIFVHQDVKKSLMIILKNILRRQRNANHHCTDVVSLRIGKNTFLILGNKVNCQHRSF
jgi:ppGpp synthetase/RelA/SpoT-type nucleotidyltranferase